MKITCINCSAKYSLADDKVNGRSFKVRCKKCGEPIVVRAASEAPEPLTAARNESSALFSLAQLKDVSQARRAEPTPPRTTDGSGLIDIRALAASVQSGAPSSPAKPSEDLLTSFASPLAAPIVLTPPAKKRTAPAIAVASVAAAIVAVAAAVIAVVAIGGGNDARAEVPPEPERPIATRNSDPIVPQPVVRQPLATHPVVPAPVVQPVVQQPVAQPRRPRRPEPVAQNHEERPRPVATNEDESLEEMVEDLAPGQRRPRPQSIETLPSTPSRGDVTSALGSVASAVRTCGQGAHGMATTRIVFSGETGRVSDAQVTSASLSPEVRSCVARAVRGAHVPRFTQRTFSVNYPFSL